MVAFRIITNCSVRVRPSTSLKQVLATYNLGWFNGKGPFSRSSTHIITATRGFPLLCYLSGLSCAPQPPSLCQATPQPFPSCFLVACCCLGWEGSAGRDIAAFLPFFMAGLSCWLSCGSGTEYQAQRCPGPEGVVNRTARDAWLGFVSLISLMCSGDHSQGLQNKAHQRCVIRERLGESVSSP